ncbi:MAG: arginase family protein [Candidatus Woesearchaeota archaeon]
MKEIIKIPYNSGKLNKIKGVELAPNLLSNEGKEININELNSINCKNKIFLGGDHSITIPIIKEILPKGIIIFDAHSDCDKNININGNMDLVRELILNNIIEPKNIIIVGLRKEDEFLKKYNVNYFTMNEIYLEGLNEVIESVMSIAKNFSSCYLSLDIDVLDQVYVQGTEFKEPGGLSSSELFYFLNRLKYLNNIISMDLVEINPNLDKENTIKIGKRIIEIMK